MRKYALFTLTRPKSQVSEAFRALRTNLRFSNVDHELKIILFTSAGPGEGKSSTVANLGVSIAQLGEKVLVIDADLRNPSQHKIMGLENNKGLSTSLVTSVSFLEQIQHSQEANLDFLTSGPIPPNPAELLGSMRMKQLLNEAAEAYDIVLVDTSPTIAVTDSSVLAQLVDGVVLVLGAGEVSRNYALITKEQLEKVGAKIIGVVLNKVELNTEEYYYYSYYGTKHTKSKSRRG